MNNAIFVIKPYKWNGMWVTTHGNSDPWLLWIDNT